MMRLYLAGAIHGCTDAEARGWRDDASAALSGRYRCVDPMERDYRGREWETDPAAIVEADLRDIDFCDVVLVNVERASWGTAMELHHAATMGRYIVAFGAGVSSPWVRHHATRWARTLADALMILRAEAEAL